jgi:hypothetical protein
VFPAASAAAVLGLTAEEEVVITVWLELRLSAWGSVEELVCVADAAPALVLLALA